MVFHFTVWQAAVEDGQMDVWLNLGIQDFGEAAGDANDVTVQFQDVDHVRKRIGIVLDEQDGQHVLHSADSEMNAHSITAHAT